MTTLHLILAGLGLYLTLGYFRNSDITAALATCNGPNNQGANCPALVGANAKWNWLPVPSFS